MRKAEYFYKLTSEQKNLSLSLVTAVNQYFWKKGVKKNLSEANYRAIYIRNLGTITISRWKLNKTISEVIEKVRHMEASKWHREVTKKKVLIFYRVLLTQLLKRRNEIAKEILEIRPNKVKIRPLTLDDYKETNE